MKGVANFERSKKVVEVIVVKKKKRRKRKEEKRAQDCVIKLCLIHHTHTHVYSRLNFYFLESHNTKLNALGSEQGLFRSMPQPSFCS